MRLTQSITRLFRTLVFAAGCFGPLFESATAFAAPSVPSVIQNGFDIWAKKGSASWAIDVWRAGGLLDGDSKAATISSYLSRVDRKVGNFKSFEAIDAKTVGESSQIIYITVKFEKAALYARFLVYRTDKDWVVQNMDFSPNPEAVMPWLAFAGTTYNE